MKRKKQLISIVLVLQIIILTMISGSITGAAKQKDSSKISEDLQDIIDNSNDEYITVGITLQEVDVNQIRSELQKSYNINMEQYEDATLYFSEVVPNIMVGSKSVGELLEDNHIENILSLNENDNESKNHLSRDIRKAIVQDKNDYLIKYRKAYAKYVKEIISNFTEKYENLYQKVLFASQSVGVLIVTTRTENIEKLADIPEVISIESFVNSKAKAESWSALEITDADSINGLGSVYDGTEIKIGIIEAENGRFSSSDVNLLGLEDNGTLTYISNPSSPSTQISSHATALATLICGKQFTIGGKVYEGFAKGAEVYQTGFNDTLSLLNAVDIMVAQGVDIINISAGLDTNNTNYTFLDRSIDKVIYEDKVAIVISAGNSGNYITSPGKSYNAIVVGALDTKYEHINDMLPAPYSIATYSSYNENNHLANKPDVVAPGSYLRLPGSATSTHIIYNHVGTSYSAAITTGLLAQVMEADAFAIGQPNGARCYLMCGASNSCITGINTDCGALSNESGAGLVNARKSVGYHYLLGNDFYALYSGGYQYNNNNTYKTRMTVHLNEGDTLRVALSYMNLNYKTNTWYNSNNICDNIDLKIVSSSYEDYYAEASSTRNNAEVLEFTAYESDTYYIQTRLTSSEYQNNGYNNLQYWISYRIF